MGARAVIGPGTRVQGRYRLVRQLGAIADATVWEAVDVALDRRVEVRLLHPRLAGDPAAAEAFRRAARAAAHAVTPGGARVLDAGDDAASGTPFVVAEPMAETAGATAAPATPELAATRPLAVAPPRSRARPVRSPGLDQHGGGGRRSLAGFFLLAAVLLLAGGLVVGGVVFGSRLLGRDTPTAQPSQSVALTAPSAGPTRAEPPSPTAVVAGAAATVTRAPVRATAAASATAGAGAGARRRVVNTDGRGVALRSSPGGDRLPEKGYDEGAVVTLLGESGEWAHIRGDDGREGWVLAVTLAP